MNIDDKLWAGLMKCSGVHRHNRWFYILPITIHLLCCWWYNTNWDWFFIFVLSKKTFYMVKLANLSNMSYIRFLLDKKTKTTVICCFKKSNSLNVSSSKFWSNRIVCNSDYPIKEGPPQWWFTASIGQWHSKERILENDKILWPVIAER